MNLWQRFRQWLRGEQNVYYIGGSDVLPPPLKGEAERQAIEGLGRGEEAARQTLVEHNLRLVVYIARRFENTGTSLEDLISIGTIRAHEGHWNLSHGKEHQAGNLCLPMH